jgi:hypothetical protein
MSSSSFPPEELKQIVQEVATLLKERKETISVAETVGTYQLQAKPRTNTLQRQQVASYPQPCFPFPAHPPTTKAA